MVILHIEFGLVWAAPWPEQRDLFLKFLNLETQKVPYEIRMKCLLFFARQAIPKILFVLNFNYTADTPIRFWFGLASSLARANIPIFKIPYSRNSKSSV